MPYKLSKKGEKYCVHNSETGENKGCSDSRKMAVAHMRRLYMVESESKGKDAISSQEIEGMIIKAAADFTLETGESFAEEDLTVDKDYYGESPLIYTPPLYGATSYAEVEAQQEAYKAQAKIENLIWDFPALAKNIMSDPEIEDKGVAVEGLAKELATLIESIKADDEENDDKGLEEVAQKTEETGVENTLEEGKETGEQEVVVENKSILKKAIESLQNALSIFDRKSDKATDSDIMFWKEADGKWMWLARYSNNFLDDDSPPDIISEKSHRRFVEMVDKGVYPYPELWLWHNKEWNIGEAVWCAYDDSGFAIAVGHSNPGSEPVFEAISKLKGVGLSHGMPIASIVRDSTDNRIILEHQTKEISVLPLYAAANRLTSFFILEKEEAEMPIPKEKKAEALEKWGLSPTLLSQIESLNKSTAEQAMKDGLESKEKDDTTAVVPNTSTEAPPEEKKVDEELEGFSEEVLNEAPSRKELADALAPHLLHITQLNESINTLKGEIETLKSLRAEDQAKAEKAKADEVITRMTPTAALLGMFGNSVIGDQTAKVGENDDLAKSKPKENDPVVEVKTGIPFVDAMLSQPQGGSK